MVARLKAGHDRLISIKWEMKARLAAGQFALALDSHSSPRNEGEYEQHREYNKQDLCDSTGRTCDATETK